MDGEKNIMAEGHSPFAITALLKNLPYFFKKIAPQT